MRGAVDRLYERLGPRRHVAVYYSLFACLEVVLCAIAVTAFLRYRDLTTGEYLQVLVVAETTIVALTAVAVVSGRRVLGPGVRLVRQHGAQFNGRRPQHEPVARLQSEALEQDIGRGRAERTVPFAEQILP